MINEDEDLKHKCKIIAPTIEYLNNEKILTDLLCTVPHCNEIFSNISALNLHLNKVHKLESIVKTSNDDDNSLDLGYLKTKTLTRAQRSVEQCNCKYYCPANNCKYNQKINNGARHLPTFHSLKVHFIRIHGEKPYACCKCSRKFSIKSEMSRHQEKCGQVFKCSCGCPFSTIDHLIKHAQIQSHCIPPYSELLTKHSQTKQSAKSGDDYDDDSDVEPTNKKQLKKLKALIADLRSKNQAPRIIIINNISSPVQTSTNNNNNSLVQKQSSNEQTTTNSCNLFKLPYFEPCQRSLGCQTQLVSDTNKIETASQTPILSINQANSVHSAVSEQHLQHQNIQTVDAYDMFKYYETQHTQTGYNMNNENNNLSIHQFYGSASNGEAIINDDQFWAEISTQTFLSVFEQNQQLEQQHQCQEAFITNTHQQTVHSTSNANELKEKSAYQVMSDEQFHREIQTCNVTSNTAYTQTSQSTNTNAFNNNNNELDFIDSIILNSYSTTETQTHDVSCGTIDCQTSNHYQLNDDCFIQTNSIQTQTFNEFNELVDNITQTPWDFNINDDLMF